jgi:maltooligosyltrehalose trehalohydrolase
VWAPIPERVDVVLAAGSVPMEAASGGWWQCDGVLEHGERYGFSLAGGPPRPDPRSPWQPDGVDGLSAAVDHARFAWTDGGWRGIHLPGAVLYELHVGTFSAAGTFTAALERLDHLCSLGVDAVELMPVAEFSGCRGWGYDGVDLYAPHHAYGGPEGLKQFVDGCHAAGIGVVMDVVYNHLGPAGNYLPEFGPYFSDRHQTAWGPAVNFDGPGSHEVRRFVIDNALMWLRDYHCDGLRLDATHAIVDESAFTILEELGVEVQHLAAHLGRSLAVIAESDRNDPRLVRSREAGGYGLDAAWADEWHHALHTVLTGEGSGYYEDFGSLADLAKALRQAWVHDGTWSVHRQRRHGRRPAGLPGSRFVVCTQNHDQVGNRAGGERLSQLTSTGRLYGAAALLLTSPFVPLLFAGEEWGASTPFLYFTDHPDPELGAAVTAGRRAEFQSFAWDGAVQDPQASETFERSVLRWDELTTAPHDGLLAWYRELIALRRTVPELTDGRLDEVDVSYDDEAGWVVVRRHSVRVAVNVGAGVVSLPALPGERPLLSSSPESGVFNDRVVVAPDGVVVCRR